jgi:hypothetical protein
MATYIGDVFEDMTTHKDEQLGRIFALCDVGCWYHCGSPAWDRAFIDLSAIVKIGNTGRALFSEVR